MNRVTMQNIADALGVSVGLVSIALRDKYGVSDSMREQIVLKALEMGFDFSAVRTKVAKKTITLIINNIELITSSFWSEIVRGISSAVSSENFILNIACWYESMSAEDIVMSIHSSSSCGVILINNCLPAVMDKLHELNIPVVLVDFQFKTKYDYDEVRTQNFKSFYDIGQFLVCKGHRKIMFCGNPDFSLSFLERYEGFLKGIEKCGTKIEVLHNISAPHFNHDVNEDFKIFDRNEFRRLLFEQPTAICCANDPIAKFVYDELESIGKKIPDDISVIGYDNVKFCEKLNPRLSSCAVPRQEIGRQSVDLLVARLKQPKSPKKVIMLAADIIERESVKEIILR